MLCALTNKRVEKKRKEKKTLLNALVIWYVHGWTSDPQLVNTEKITGARTIKKKKEGKNAMREMRFPTAGEHLDAHIYLENIIYSTFHCVHIEKFIYFYLRKTQKKNVTNLK